MVISGYFIVKRLSETDSAGFHTQAICENCMDGLEYRLFIPPYLRACVCPMAVGKKVFGFADEASGLGSMVMGVDCDTDYTCRTNYHYTQNVTVDGECMSQGISLAQHRHQIVVIPASDAALIAAAAVGGTAPAILESTYTIMPD